jgi:hypothetical protein
MTIYQINKDILKEIKEFEEIPRTVKKDYTYNYHKYKKTVKECQKKYYENNCFKVKCKKCNNEYTFLYYKNQHIKKCYREL